MRSFKSFQISYFYFSVFCLVHLWSFIRNTETVQLVYLPPQATTDNKSIYFSKSTASDGKDKKSYAIKLPYWNSYKKNYKKPNLSKNVITTIMTSIIIIIIDYYHNSHHYSPKGTFVLSVLNLAC